MPDVNLNAAAVKARNIRTTDVIPAFNPDEVDASESGRTDTLAEVIATIFQNPPDSLTDDQATALRTLLEIAHQDDVPDNDDIDARVQEGLTAAVTGNTETGIAVTRQSDGTIDFVVDDAVRFQVVIADRDPTEADYDAKRLFFNGFELEKVLRVPLSGHGVTFTTSSLGINAFEDGIYLNRTEANAAGTPSNGQRYYNRQANRWERWQSSGGYWDTQQSSAVPRDGTGSLWAGLWETEQIAGGHIHRAGQIAAYPNADGDYTLYRASAISTQSYRYELGPIVDLHEYLTEEEIEARFTEEDLYRGEYSSSSTYTAPQIVKESGGSRYFMYTDTTDRDSDHDPAAYPEYWLEVSAGLAFISDAGNIARRYRPGHVFYASGTLYLCETRPSSALTATQVVASSDFINLTERIDDSTIDRDSSRRLRVKDGGIAAAKLATSAVSSAKLAGSAVTTAKIASSAVTDAKLANAKANTDLQNVASDLTETEQDTVTERIGTGVKFVTALPSEGDVANADRGKLYGVRANRTSHVTEWNHLRPVADAEVGYFTAATSGNAQGFGSGYGHHEANNNIVSIRETLSSGIIHVMRVDVASTGEIPRDNDTKSIYIRERGSSDDWRGFDMINGADGTFVSLSYDKSNGYIDAGHEYEYVIVDNQIAGNEADTVTNPPAADRFDAWPGGAKWVEIPDIEDLSSLGHITVIVEETRAATTNKADTDLGNVDDDLTDDEKTAIRTKIGVGESGDASDDTKANVDLQNLDSALTDDEKSNIRTDLGYGDVVENDVGLGSGNIPQLDSGGDVNIGVIPAGIARVSNPTFTGSPKSTTPSAGDDSTRIATTAFVQDEAVVEANPTGSDGDNLTRINIGGTNYNIPEGGGGGGGGGVSEVAFGSSLRSVNYSSTVQSDTTGVAILNIADADIEFEHGDFTVTTESGVSKVTVPEAGVYEITFGARFGTTSSASNRRISAAGAVVVDRLGAGTDIDYFYGPAGYFRGIATTENPTIGCSVLVELATTDEVTIHVVSDSQGDPQNLTVYTDRSHFGMVKVAQDPSDSGQESPAEEGVTELTADRVSVLFYKYGTTLQDAPTAHWRFDDEWDDEDTPGDEGWHTSEASALETAELDPDYATAGYYLQTAQETVRRRLNSDGDAYTYTDSGYTVTAAWDVQYSTNAIESHETYDSTLDHYTRFRDSDGTLGPWIPIGTTVGANTWLALVSHQNVYPGNASEDNVVIVYDFGLFSDILFLMTGFRNVTVEVDGEDEVQRHLGPIHSFVLKRGGGFVVADESSGEENNLVTNKTYQWRYNSVDGLTISLLQQASVNPDVASFVQADSEPPTQVGGRFKIISTNGDEAHVNKIRFFGQSNSYGRMDLSLYGRLA